MNYLAKNISVRGCEKLGIIGNGISSAIVDKSGMIEWASFEKWRWRKDQKTNTNLIYVNKFLKIGFEKTKETKQFYIKDTAIFVTVITSQTNDKIRINQYFPRKIGEESIESMLIQEVIILRGKPKISITCNLTTNEDNLDPIPYIKTKISYQPYILSVSQFGIVDKILNNKPFVLTRDLTVVFGVEGHKHYSYKMLGKTMDFWIQRVRKLDFSDINISLRTKNELKRAIIQLSHCQSAMTGNIFPSAAKKVVRQDNSSFYLANKNIDFLAVSRFVSVCGRLKDKEPIDLFSNVLHILINDSFLPEETDEYLEIEKFKKSLSIEILQQKLFSDLVVEDFKIISSYILSVVNVGGVNNTVFYSKMLNFQNTPVIRCVLLCDYMITRWNTYITNEKTSFIKFGSILMGLVVYAIEVFYQWLIKKNLEKFYLFERTTKWKEQLEDMKRQICSFCMCPLNCCFTSSLFLDEESDRKEDYIDPYVFYLPKFLICQPANKFFEKSLNLVTKRYMKDSLLSFCPLRYDECNLPMNTPVLLNFFLKKR